MSARLDEIEARLRAATPGSWVSGQQRPAHSDTLLIWDAVFSDTPEGLIAYVNTGEATAALIANAPSDLAALLRVARAAEAYCRALSEAGTTVEGFGRAADEFRAALDDL